MKKFILNNNNKLSKLAPYDYVQMKYYKKRFLEKCCEFKNCIWETLYGDPW